MATGIRIPVQAGRGRVLLSSGAEQTAKIITLSVLEAGSTNPFLRPGIDAPLFQPTTTGTTALLRRRIEERFRRLKVDRRAELVDLTFRVGDEEGELVMDLTYRDLHEDRLENVQRRLRG